MKYVLPKTLEARDDTSLISSFHSWFRRLIDATWTNTTTASGLLSHGSYCEQALALVDSLLVSYLLGHVGRTLSLAVQDLLHATFEHSSIFNEVLAFEQPPDATVLVSEH